jgi:phosphoadenosine phosphosulfate reductase
LDKSLITKELQEKIDVAIERIKNFCPPEGYYLSFSGGKDSTCIYYLAKMAGVKFDAHYNLTTIDPPELVMFIRDKFPEVEWHRPEMPFLRYMSDVKMFPPLRKVRYCCTIYKEHGGDGRVKLIGIRRAESPRRKKLWKMVEHCYQDGSRSVMPILDWEDEDVWGFIKGYGLPYCSLYDEGFKRLGCVMCPMTTVKNRIRESKRWPKLTQAFKKAFVRMFENREKAGKKPVANVLNAEEWFNWWLTEEDPRQGRFDFSVEEEK